MNVTLPILNGDGSAEGRETQGLWEEFANVFPPRRTEVPQPGGTQAISGFFTDTTLCIGCKACEVACKQ